MRYYFIGLRAAFHEILLIIYSNLTGYYKNLDKLPIYNWDKIINGDYSYLYKKRLKKTPRFFEYIYIDLFFQLEKVEMSGFENMLKLSYLKSLYITTKEIKFLNQANFLEAKIKSENITNPPKLNDMLNFIEQTFSAIGNINVYKMNTLRFYSLYYNAIEKNKQNAYIKKD